MAAAMRLPRGGFGFDVLSTGLGQLVVLRPPVALGFTPVGFQPALLFEPVRRREGDPAISLISNVDTRVRSHLSDVNRRPAVAPGD
jgi:hypothetical protein